MIVGRYSAALVDTTQVSVIQSIAHGGLTITGSMDEPEIFIRDRAVRIANDTGVTLDVYFSGALTSTPSEIKTFFHCQQFTGTTIEYTGNGLTIVRDRAGVTTGSPPFTPPNIPTPIVDSEDQATKLTGDLSHLQAPLRAFEVCVAAQTTPGGNVTVDYLGREPFLPDLRDAMVTLPAPSLTIPARTIPRFDRVDHIFHNEQLTIGSTATTGASGVGAWIGPSGPSAPWAPVGGWLGQTPHLWTTPVVPWSHSLTIWSNDDETDVNRRAFFISCLKSPSPVSVSFFFNPSPGSYAPFEGLRLQVPPYCSAYVDKTGIWFQRSHDDGAGIVYTVWRDGLGGSAVKALIGGFGTQVVFGDPAFIDLPCASFSIGVSYNDYINHPGSYSDTVSNPNPAAITPPYPGDGNGFDIELHVSEGRMSRVAP